MSSIPHQAIITLQIKGEVCEQLPSGQVGKPKRKLTRVSRLYTVTGSTLEECENKANKTIQQIAEVLDERT